ncbi:MAG: GAF domain-containing protein [Desulfobacterales bacterium]|nr:GAF domain-containing protein [Desulfobacterales bacterium]
MTAERTAPFIDLYVEVTKAITASLDLDKVFDLITEKIPDVMGVDAATIRLLDASGKNLVLKASRGLSREYLNRGTIDTEEPVFKALKGEPIVIEDAANDPRIKYPDATKKEGISSILAVPITVQDEIIGILRLLTEEVRYFSEADVNFAMAVAEQGGVAIQRAIDYNKIRPPK